jgi:hypothetical protein
VAEPQAPMTDLLLVALSAALLAATFGLAALLDRL